VTELPAPTTLTPASPKAVREQAIVVDPAWWESALRAAGVDAKPLRVRLDDRGRTVLWREDVWHVADDRDYDVLDLLWHSMAWGAGRYRRLCRARMASVKRAPAAAIELLEAARERSAAEPGRAYELLHPGGKGALRFLGPAFGTKYLYFAGAGRGSHRSLILDSRVAESLRALSGWSDLPAGAWSADTYERYCDVLEGWREARSLKTAAQWELALFDPSTVPE